MKKILFLIILVGLLFVNLNTRAASGLDQINVDSGTVDQILSDLPGMVYKIYKEEVLPIFTQIYNWAEVNIWERIKPQTKEEIRKRKEIVKEESQKEKDQLIEDIGNLSIKNDIWEKIKTFLLDLWN